ncbi:MAG: hypothetical protein JXA67_19610, partial [Micromonosporaceae bacterium]|nr:hypothetical protein [Micromonosporaceae bacterium]
MGLRRSWAVSVAIAAIAALGLAGCGDSADDSTSSGGTLTVWLMNGSASDELIRDLNAEFEQSHSGMTVDYQVQQWDGIQD